MKEQIGTISNIIDLGPSTKIIVEMTGPDHEPTTETKWYAQAENLPLHVSRDYAFGPTPEKAMSNLLLDLMKNYGITL
jgi:hypothetical protein